MLPLPPLSTLFPYTTLFRSCLRMSSCREQDVSKRAGSRLFSRRVSVDSRSAREGGSGGGDPLEHRPFPRLDRKSTRLNSSHTVISYAVFCLKKNNKKQHTTQ